MKNFAAPSMTMTLTENPLNNYYCYYCSYHDAYCEYCAYAPSQLYWAHYYAGYYSPYYSTYYSEALAEEVHIWRDRGFTERGQQSQDRKRDRFFVLESPYPGFHFGHGQYVDPYEYDDKRSLTTMIWEEPGGIKYPGVPKPG